jgi:hypothetical protein
MFEGSYDDGSKFEQPRGVLIDRLHRQSAVLISQKKAHQECLLQELLLFRGRTNLQRCRPCGVDSPPGDDLVTGKPHRDTVSVPFNLTPSHKLCRQSACGNVTCTEP